MTKAEARQIMRAFDLILKAKKTLDAITNKAVERDEFIVPVGLYKDLDGLAGALDIAYCDYEHRMWDAGHALNPKAYK